MRSYLITGILVAASPAAHAGLSQSMITPPGGFVQAGAYPSSCGCGMAPGGDLAALYGASPDFHEQAFAGNSSATASSAYSSETISNSATGTCGLGYIRMHTENTSPNNAFFAIGAANGGWKETFTVSHAALNGQPGYMVFRIRARGSMNTSGFTGATSLSLTAYKDNSQLMMNALYDRGTSDPASTDRQWASWGLASFGPPDSRTVDSTVTMAVPITFGQSFSLGVYAMAAAGQRSSGSVQGSGSGTLDFSGPGLEWAGITSVQSGGAPVSGYTIVSGSGLDWNPPFGACDPDVNCDGSINGFDIEATEQAINGDFSNFCQASADLNGDGAENGFDIETEEQRVNGAPC